MNPDVQHRLLNYSQTPPPTAWQCIEEALDAPAYARKLHNHEVMPPASVWQKVAQQLEAAPQTKVIPLRTKLFKYAIAASVLAIIAAGSLFYLTNTHTPNLATQPKNKETNQLKNSALDANSGLKTQVTNGQNINTAEFDEGLIMENTIAQGAAIHFSSRVRIAQKQNLPMQALSILPEEKTFIDTERADRYMIATTANGKAVRLPKKAYSDYACADAYTNSRCKEKIASIQNKMAASVTTDFTDFMDLLKKLQDN